MTNVCVWVYVYIPLQDASLVLGQGHLDVIVVRLPKASPLQHNAISLQLVCPKT